MDTLIERCAGLDIGKADLKACIRTPGGRVRRQEIRTFTTTTTTTPGLLELRDWLAVNEVTVVGMEATGSYWKPVYYLLEDAFEVQLSTPGTCVTFPAARPTLLTRPGSPG